MARVCLAEAQGQAYTGSMSTETQGRASEGSSRAGAVGVALTTAAILLPLGMLVYVVSTMAHPAREDPNSYAPVFTEYAASDTWIAVHFAQYAAVLLLIGGLVALCLAMVHEGSPLAFLARLGLVTAAATVASFTLLFAVDGVALKRAVDEWVTSIGTEQADAALAAAQAIRWTEYGVNAFSFVLLGLTLTFVSVALIQTRMLPRWAGWWGLVVGVALAVHGVMVGYVAFAPTAPGNVALPGLVGWTLVAAFLIWRRPAQDALPSTAAR
jgi:hypothetical protein